MQLVGSQRASFTSIIPNLEMQVLQGTEWGASWKYYSIIVRISCDTALRGGASARSQVWQMYCAASKTPDASRLDRVQRDRQGRRGVRESPARLTGDIDLAFPAARCPLPRVQVEMVIPKETVP